LNVAMCNFILKQSTWSSAWRSNSCCL